jgi:DNA-directed RNA polymerase specialized sigma subunit
VSTFKPDKNVRLATYASRCIENAILSPVGFQFRKECKTRTKVLNGR